MLKSRSFSKQAIVNRSWQFSKAAMAGSSDRRARPRSAVLNSCI
jgi:hypothetical protein